MSATPATGPIYPPGLWRRIELHPRHQRIVAGLEDDVHRFLIRLSHREGIITGVEAKAERFPWSTCADAGLFLKKRLTGMTLQAVAAEDPYSHCTHLFELAVVSAARAFDAQSIRFDLKVADRVAGRTSATLAENGHTILQWHLDGTLIEGPAEWTGRDLRRFSDWKQDLSTDNALRAMLLRRAIHISGARKQPQDLARRAADRGPSRMGACFTYQMPRALDAVQTADWRRDFSLSDTSPLHDFDPERLMHDSWTIT